MLELRNVTAGYDGHIVLRDVSLVVPDGAVVALLGPNGAGKTTLLRVASGLLAPTRGQVLLDGTDITGWSSDRRARAGLCLVPEGRGVFPALSVHDNLRLGAPARLARTAAERAKAAFPVLADRTEQLAGTMSGGEQQMLALARAYSAEANLILLDEVSMGLAPRIVDEIFERLRALAAEGRSLLLVEQYVNRALDLADYVYILRKGAIEFAAEPAELGDEVLMSAYMGGR